MGSEKPNFLSQPVVKNVFMFRNGDPYYEARRIVINEKRVCNFETLLREVTGGIQAPFGAVRNIYTPRGGHRVECLESLQSGEQYVAAGKEKFKKLDYLDIGTRKKRMMQTLPVQARPLPQNRIIVSARFLKPIKEPCTIFVVANGDVLNPAMRLLIHQRMMGQFDRILEMITEKMGLRVLGGVRSLYTYEGQQVTDGNKLECGQLYVAVGRERFKRLPYSDLLFTRPKGTRRIRGMKSHSLPPIYRFSKQSGNSKSTGRSSESGDGDSKASPSNHCSNSREHLASAVREISQARVLTLRKKKSGQSITADTTDNDDVEAQADGENTDGKTSLYKDEEKSDTSDDQKASKEDSKKTEEEPCYENTTETDRPTSKDDKEEIQDTNVEKGEGKKEADEKSDEKGEKEAGEQSDEKEKKEADEQSDEKEKKETDEQSDEKEQKEADEQSDEKGEKEADEQSDEKGEKKEADEQSDKKGEKEADEQSDEKGEKEADEQSDEKGEKKEADEQSDEKGEKKEADEKSDEKEEEGTAVNEQSVDEGKEVKEQVRAESKNEVNSEEQASTSSTVGDKIQDNEKQKEGLTTSSEAEEDQANNVDDDRQEKAGGNREESSNDHSNDEDTGEAQKQTENSYIPGETQSDNKRKASGNSRSSSRKSNMEENVFKSKDNAPKGSENEKKINGEVNGDDEKVESQADQETKNSDSCEDATEAKEQKDDVAKDNQ